MSKQKTKRVACCLIRDWKDDILMGKRNDNDKWTTPGGHLDKGECPYEGAIRELKEEKLAEEGVILITKRGKPIAILERFTETDFAKQFDEVRKKSLESAEKAGVSPKDIDKIIQEVRKS